MNFNYVKRAKDEINDGDIPNWLLEELLIRLPQKVVFRLKLVSKQWLSTISDPSFIRIYCSRALSLHKSQPWTFIFSSTTWDDSFSNHSPDGELLVDIYSSNLKWPQICVLPLPSLYRSYCIYQVSNGFVVYGKYNNSRICNPVTGQWISLPPHSDREIGGWGFLTNVEDGVLVSYTVVRLYFSKTNRSMFVKCEVFSSEDSEWKKHDMPLDKYIEVVNPGPPAIVNGVMHWMLREHELIAYDPLKKPDHIRFIALPGEPRVRYSQYCAAYEGQLRYFEVSKSKNINPVESFNIWVLSDHNSGDWCLQHRVDYDNIQNCTAFSSLNLKLLLPKSFHPYDSDIIYLEFDRWIISYNIRTTKMEVPKDFTQLQRPGIPMDGRLHTCLFLIPPWPVSFSRHTIRASED